MVDIPACLIIGILSVVPTLITKKFSRWQGVLMLAAYAVYIAVSYTHLGAAHFGHVRFCHIHNKQLLVLCWPQYSIA